MATSEYKNASKKVILEKLIELKETGYPFKRKVLLLQGDSFWIYTNARRYWGLHAKAIREAGVENPLSKTRNEFGYEIDWWDFDDSFLRKEWLTTSLRCLSSEGVDISTVALKKSPYFDLVTDGYSMFGSYSAALEVSGIPPSEGATGGIRYPENKPVLDKVVKMYTSDDIDEKCDILKDLDPDAGKNLDPLYPEVAGRLVIVDGSNIATADDGVSNFERIRLVDRQLQKMGFRRENITYLFDATFRHRIGAEVWDTIRKDDIRLQLTPVREQADSHILATAMEWLRECPENPPLIVTNDSYRDYFTDNPNVGKLQELKRGISWTFVHKKLVPHISLLRPPTRPA